VSRKMAPSKIDQNIQMGEAYSKLRSSAVRFGNVEIDRLDKGGHLIVTEYKKTLANLDSAKAQLLFYMYLLKNSLRLKRVDGYIVSEEQQEKIFLRLDKKNEAFLLELLEKITEVLSSQVAPKEKPVEVCKNCAFRHYCLD